VRPRPCFTDAILTQPYGGTCQVGCSFCYINSGVRGYRGAGLVTVPVGYGEHVRNQLMTMRTSAAGYFSSFTDPFLPLEDLYHNTQAGAEEFVRQGLPVFFLSRLSYPSWAKDILTVNRHSYAQKSINTPDEDVWRKLSPGAISLREHLEEIREMRSRNIYVSIQRNPIIPGLVNHNDVERLFEKLAAAGANHVIVKFVEAGYSWASTMVERHVKRFGAERMEPFVRLFTQNIGGQKTVDEAYRLEGLERYRRRATELGLTYSTCYEYKYLRDEAGDPVNKRGVSIGADFITSAQCHGHRVPMYTRTSSAEQFAEVKECPPTGCLLCADNNAGKPRCGSELFGSAKALRLADLRKGVR
jgi:DNA repair photolyase